MESVRTDSRWQHMNIRPMRYVTNNTFVGNRVREFSLYGTQLTIIFYLHLNKISNFSLFSLKYAEYVLL
jgi:hypothetical protein